jgi:Flp pilus assembly protein TadB
MVITLTLAYDILLSLPSADIADLKEERDRMRRMEKASQWEQGVGVQLSSQASKGSSQAGHEAMLQWSTLSNALLFLLIVVLLVRIMPEISHETFVCFVIAAVWTVTVLVIRRYK